MLHQTQTSSNSHHHSSSSSSSLSLFLHRHLSSKVLSHSQDIKSVEMALKNSNRKEKAVTDVAHNDDEFDVDDLLDFSNDDEFDVDDLLDFSNDDIFVDDDADLETQRNCGVSDEITLHRSNDLSTAGEDVEPLLSSSLAVPTDNLEDFDWFTNIVDDSFTPYWAPTKKPALLTGDRRDPVEPVKEESCFKPPLPVKSRTKRGRTRVSVWSLGSSSLNDSSSSSTTSSSSSSAPSSPLWLSGAEILDETVVNRQKKMNKKKNVMKNGGQTQTQTRRCSHCGVQKTPQWREGPLGAKTLCNACGVRYKSGRLLPEYRPACSPTFSSELHSNHHRKVIEMRRKKKTSDDANEPGSN